MIDALINQPRQRKRHRSLAEARALVAEWQASGQSKEAWCQQHGIPRSVLYAYLRRTRTTECATALSSPFIELLPPQETAPARMLRLAVGGSGAVVELSIADLVAVIQSLDGSQP
jgi:hypothetical protein